MSTVLFKLRSEYLQQCPICLPSIWFLGKRETKFLSNTEVVRCRRCSLERSSPFGEEFATADINWSIIGFSLSILLTSVLVVGVPMAQAMYGDWAQQLNRRASQGQRWDVKILEGTEM